MWRVRGVRVRTMYPVRRAARAVRPLLLYHVSILEADAICIGMFVDPYKVRAQEREERTKQRKMTAPAVVAGKPRAKVGDMVKFFDQEVRR